MLPAPAVAEAGERAAARPPLTANCETAVEPLLPVTYRFWPDGVSSMSAPMPASAMVAGDNAVRRPVEPLIAYCPTIEPFHDDAHRRVLSAEIARP